MTLESGLKSLRHVAMVAKFVDDNKQKTSEKSLNYFKLPRPYSVSFNLSNIGEII